MMWVGVAAGILAALLLLGLLIYAIFWTMDGPFR